MLLNKLNNQCNCLVWKIFKQVLIFHASMIDWTLLHVLRCFVSVFLSQHRKEVKERAKQNINIQATESESSNGCRERGKEFARMNKTELIQHLRTAAMSQKHLLTPTNKLTNKQTNANEPLLFPSSYCVTLAKSYFFLATARVEHVKRQFVVVTCR